MEEIIINIPENNTIPVCEKYLNNMFLLTLLPAVRHNNKFIKYAIPSFSILVLFISVFSLLWYPGYYATQEEIWTTDIIIGLIVYSYMIHLHNNWKITECYENVDIIPWKNNLSFSFYVFFNICNFKII